MENTVLVLTVLEIIVSWYNCAHFRANAGQKAHITVPYIGLQSETRLTVQLNNLACPSLLLTNL